MQKHRLPIISQHNVRKCAKAARIGDLSGLLDEATALSLSKIGDYTGSMYYTLVEAVVEIGKRRVR